MTQTGPTPASLTAAGVSLSFHPRGGVLCDLSVQDEGATIAPLHRAPWAETEVPPDAPPHQRWLQGDFLAAPMGPGPQGLHGPAANGDSALMPAAPGTLARSPTPTRPSRAHRAA